MKIKTYKFICFFLYILGIFSFFVSLYLIEFCDIFNACGKIFLLLLAIILLLIPIRLCSLILKKYGILEEKFGIEKSLNNFEICFKDYIYDEHYEKKYINDLDIVAYEKNLNKNICRFVIIDYNRLLNDKVDVKEYISNIYNNLNLEITLNDDINMNFYNYLIIISNEIDDNLSCLVTENTFLKPLSIRGSDHPFVGLCIFPVVICKQDNSIYFGKSYDKPFFVEHKRNYIKNMIRDIFRS